MADPSRRAAAAAFGTIALGLAAGPAGGQADAPAPPPPLFLAQLALGRGWDAARPAQDQPGFREHSANLARMRRSGALLFGARTRTRGWMIVTAPDFDAARREFDDDPMLRSEAFVLELEPLVPFQRGGIGSAPR